MTRNETARTTTGADRTFLPAAPAQRLLRQQAADHAGDLSALAQVLRLDRSTLYRVLGRDRLRYDSADRIAVCLGRHPSELWPEWFPTGDQVDR
jgi:lambda repressor-like predicted transcriptional regulator